MGETNKRPKKKKKKKSTQASKSVTIYTLSSSFTIKKKFLSLFF